MKKYLLMAALLCGTSVASMAATSIVTAENQKSVTNSLANKGSKFALQRPKFACVPVTFSCGVSGYACGETTMEIIRNVILFDAVICE